MDIYKVKWTQLQSSIFRLLSIRAGKMLTLREIARNLEKTPTAVSNAIAFLEKEKVIKIERFKSIRNLSISFNDESNYAIEMKRIENLKLIYESGLFNLLHENFPGTTIVLFGSYSRGEDNFNSDIDIAIIGAKEKSIELEKFNNILERKIILNFYKSFKEIHKHLFENILNGILLNGGVEL